MKSKRFFSLFAVVVMIAVFAITAQAQEMIVTGAGMVTPQATYSQMLASGELKTISASEGGGPSSISIHRGYISGPISHGENLLIDVGGDTLDLGNADTEMYWIVRHFSEKTEKKSLTVGYDKSTHEIGFRTIIEGSIVKVEDERVLLFLSHEYSLIKIVSADQMYNDRSVAYRSFYGSHEGTPGEAGCDLLPQEQLGDSPGSGGVREAVPVIRERSSCEGIDSPGQKSPKGGAEKRILLF